MIVILYLAIALVVGYFFGNINFARIFSLIFGKKDITTVGSKNPGTMNMLRTRGFGEAFLTLIFEAIKSGGPAIGAYFLFKHFSLGFEDVAFFLTAFGAIVGHCFPVFYKFKGGKGVACTFGMFVFHPNLWWVSLVVFAFCFALFFLIEYPFILSFIYIITLSIYATCFFALNQVAIYFVLLIIIWLNFLLILFLHRGNIKRLINGEENKVNFKEKVFKKRTKKDVNVETEEEKVLTETKDENNDKTETD